MPDIAASLDPHTDAPPVSCVIRTLNEARLIAEVVAAARACAAEVIVVDCGSTDDTRALAAAAGARVIEQPWLGSGAQKRVGERAARHEWILDLDADEIVTPALAAEIRAMFARGAPDAPVYAITLVTEPPVGPPWEGFARDPRRKLYDRRRLQMPDDPTWDQLRVPSGTPVGTLSAPLRHRSFRDFEQYVAKWNRVSSARAAGARPRSTLQLGLRIVGAFPFYFLKHYLFRGLWRAGLYGFAIAAAAAHGRWMRDVKMYEARRMAAEREAGDV